MLFHSKISLLVHYNDKKEHPISCIQRQLLSNLVLTNAVIIFCLYLSEPLCLVTHACDSAINIDI